MIKRLLSFSDRFDFHFKELAGGAAVSFVLRALGVFIAFGFNLLLARKLGADGVGVYSLALSVATFATVFGRVGLDSSLVRFISSGAANGDWREVNGVYKKGIYIVLAASAAATLFVFIFAPVLAERVFFKAELVATIRLMSLSIVPMALVTLNGEALRGLKRIRDSQFIQSVSVQAFTLAGLFLFGRAWGVNGVVVGYILAAALTAVAGFWLWRLATRGTQHSSPGGFPTSRLLASSLPLMLVASMQLITGLTSTFVLGAFGTVEEVGIYSVALRTAMLTSLILMAVNSIAAPKFASLYQQNDMRTLSRTAIQSTRLTVLLSGCILALFIIAPSWVLAFFGENFRAGSTVLVILSIAQFINVSTGSVGQILTMTGHEKLLGNLVTFSAVLNIISNIIFIKYWGMTGAALSTALSWTVLNLMATYYLRKRLGLYAHLAARIG